MFRGVANRCNQTTSRLFRDAPAERGLGRWQTIYDGHARVGIRHQEALQLTFSRITRAEIEWQKRGGFGVGKQDILSLSRQTSRQGRQNRAYARASADGTHELEWDLYAGSQRLNQVVTGGITFTGKDLPENGLAG